jgi:hypothetical protein
MAKTADHVVVDFAGPRPPYTYAPENQLPLVCLHCGARYILGLPLSLTMSALVMKQFAREHRLCKPRPQPIEQTKKETG